MGSDSILPKLFRNESINRGPVCAHMIFGRMDSKDPDIQ